MFTFSINPSSGSTFLNSFSAVSNLSASDITINWGDDDLFYDYDSPHVYTIPGIYLTTLNSCSGTMHCPLTASKYPNATLFASTSSTVISAGCDTCFTVFLTSDRVSSTPLSSITETILFETLSGSAFSDVDVDFYSHLVPQQYFMNSDGDVVSSQVMDLYPISANNQVIAYTGRDVFCYHNDLPGKPAMFISMLMDDCDKSIPINQSDIFSRTVYELTPLSAYVFGFLADGGIAGAQQTSAYNVLSANRIQHLVLGGDNSYNDARGAYLSGNLSAFDSFLSARDPEFYTLVMGNHDHDSSLSAYSVLFPDFEPYGVKTIGSGLIDMFYLDSGFNSNFKNKQLDGNTVGSDQYNWFVREVSNSRSPFKIAAFHHPVVASNTTNNTRSEIVKEMDWKFEDFGISLVLNGHVHRTEILEKNGVVIVNASGAVQTPRVATSISPYSLYSSNTERAVAVIYVYPNKFTVKLINVNGVVLYTYTKTLSLQNKLYTTEDLSLCSAVELSEYLGSFSVSATNLAKTNQFFENITVKTCL